MPGRLTRVAVDGGFYLRSPDGDAYCSTGRGGTEAFGWGDPETYSPVVFGDEVSGALVWMSYNTPNVNMMADVGGVGGSGGFLVQRGDTGMYFCRSEDGSWYWDEDISEAYSFYLQTIVQLMNQWSVLQSIIVKIITG